MTTETAIEEIQPLNLERIGECEVLRDVVSQPGIYTVEGTMAPLLTGEALRSHMIVMHPGQYCDAHPHPTESIIYTVSGRWVFCTEENGEQARTVINPGDLFRFVGGVPTGFETPFEEDAIILIVKSGNPSYEEMKQGIIDARDHMAEDAAKGTPFFYKDLPEGHPAREYAIQVTGKDPGQA